MLYLCSSGRDALRREKAPMRNSHEDSRLAVKRLNLVPDTVSSSGERGINLIAHSPAMTACLRAMAAGVLCLFCVKQTSATSYSDRPFALDSNTTCLTTLRDWRGVEVVRRSLITGGITNRIRIFSDVQSLAASSKGSIVSAVGDGKIYVWGQGNRMLCSWNCRDGGLVVDSQLSASGSCLTVTYFDGAIDVYSVARNKKTSSYDSKDLYFLGACAGDSARWCWAYGADAYYIDLEKGLLKTIGLSVANTARPMVCSHPDAIYASFSTRGTHYNLVTASVKSETIEVKNSLLPRTDFPVKINRNGEMVVWRSKESEYQIVSIDSDGRESATAAIKGASMPLAPSRCFFSPDATVGGYATPFGRLQYVNAITGSTGSHKPRDGLQASTLTFGAALLFITIACAMRLICRSKNRFLRAGH